MGGASYQSIDSSFVFFIRIGLGVQIEASKVLDIPVLVTEQVRTSLFFFGREGGRGDRFELNGKE